MIHKPFATGEAIVQRFTVGAGGTLTPGLVLPSTNFSDPQSVTRSPDGRTVVTYGGSTQQVVAFDNAGNEQWRLGRSEKYETNSTVHDDKFDFYRGIQNGSSPFVVFEPD